MTSYVSAIVVTLVIQLLGWAISALKRTEKLFDLIGSLTFAGVTLALLIGVGTTEVVGPTEAFWLRVTIGAMVIIWALRLGFFLAMRARERGDARFDEIKVNPLRFLIVWIVQAVWVGVTASAAWAAITSPVTQPRLILAFLGICVWGVGFGVEVVADHEKRKFQADPRTAGRFIDVGLWSRSQHPNYFGEILLWVGVALASSSLLTGWGWLGWLSPALVTLLLTRVSGIPTLDKRAQEKWGDDADYQAYRQRTPVLIPRLRSGDSH